MAGNMFQLLHRTAQDALKAFALLLSLSVVGLSNAQDIVFDISKNQPLYLHDDSYAASSILAQSLYDHGYRVSVNQRPLDQLLQAGKPDLLVLTPTVFQYHGDAEVLAVRDYVQGGGKLLVFAEHENFFASTDNLNRFLAGSGITILPDKAEQAQYTHFAEQYRPRAVTPVTAKDSVIFFFPATLELRDSTYSLAKTTQGQHLAALAPFGFGKIGVITDFEIVWNMTRKTGYRYGQNEKFILHIMASLVGEGSHPKPVSAPKKKNVWLNSRCFESDLDKAVSYKPLVDALKKEGYGLRFSDMAGMEPGDEDIYIGLCACESRKEMEAVLKFRRLFLAGYDKVNFWNNLTAAFALFREKGYDTGAMENMLQSLWKYDGYTPVSWQDSLEMSLNLCFSRKLSFTDSIHKTRSPIGMKEPVADSPVAFNLFFDEGGYKVLREGLSNEGTYYPAPYENNVRLTPGTGHNTNYPIVVSIGQKVVSGAPALFRSDYADKPFQEKVIRLVVNQLIKQ